MLELLGLRPVDWDLIRTVLGCGSILLGFYLLDRFQLDLMRFARQRTVDDALLSPPQDWDSLHERPVELPELRP